MRKGLAMALALALVVVAQYMIWHQRATVNVTAEILAGNPSARYEAVKAPLGAVIVVHGFAGNKEQMQQWGYALARQGFTAYVIDQPGHGTSTIPLPPALGPGSNALSANLRAIVDELVKQGRAQPGRIALVGHSLGASAVVGEAVSDDRVRATVAILGGASGPLPPEQPQNLLAIAAEREIVFDKGVMDRAGSWIHKAFGTQAPGSAPAGEPWAWIWVAVVGALGVMVAAGALLAPRPDQRAASWPGRVGLVAGLAMVAVATLSAVLASVYLRIPWPRLAVVDYVLPYFMVMAAALLALRSLWPRDFGFSLGDGVEPWWAGMLRGLGVFLGFVGAVVPVIQMNFSHYIPTLPRALPTLALAVGLWPFLVQEEGLKRAIRANWGPWAGAAVGVTGKLFILATWLGASALPNPPTFLVLTIPVAAVLLLGMEAMSLILREWRYSPVAIATLVTCVLAWSIAVTFPLI